MFCVQCGKEIDNSSRFCPYCGSSVDKADTSGVEVGMPDVAKDTSFADIGVSAGLPADGRTPKKWMILAGVAACIAIIGAAAFLGLKLLQKPGEAVKKETVEEQEQKESSKKTETAETAETEKKAYPEEITLNEDVKEEVTDLLDLLCRVDGMNEGGQLSNNTAIDDSFVSSFLMCTFSENVPFVNGQTVPERNHEWTVSTKVIDQYLKDSVGCEDYDLDPDWAAYSGSNVIFKAVTPTGGYGADTSKIERVEQISDDEIRISGSNELIPDTQGETYLAEFEVILEENPDSIWGGYTLKEIKNWKQMESRKQNQSQSQTQDADASVSDGDYILPGINSRYYTENELSGLDAHTLSLARNELYARHGYIFKKPELKEYFGDKSWYTPQVTEVPDSAFNQYEKANLELIQNLEARY